MLYYLFVLLTLGLAVHFLNSSYYLSKKSEGQKLLLFKTVNFKTEGELNALPSPPRVSGRKVYGLACFFSA